jgi:hypothetical protein
MPVFAIIAKSKPEAVGQSIIEQYGATHYQFTDNVWFVPDSGTSEDVSAKVGIKDGKVGSGVVLKFSAFSGFAPKTAWTWLDAYPEAVSNG